MSRTVTGTLLLPNGQPMANARIFFTAKRTEAVSIIEGVNAFFDTNSSGVYSQVILDGFYSVSIEWQADPSGVSSRRWNLGDAVVEGGANTTLEALLIATNQPADVALTVFYEILEQTQQARDDAEAAAGEAAASAATISPTKQAQWDQAYSERNRWDGSAAGLNAAAGRSSLLLGNGSQATMVSSPTDSSPNRLLTVGYGGLGGGGIVVDLAVIPNSRFIQSNTNGPGVIAGQNVWGVAAIDPTGTSGTTFAGRGDRFFAQGKISSSLSPWRELWTTGNTSADVQALLSAADKPAMGLAIATTGTFTPTIIGTTTPGVGTYSQQSGRYSRIGNRVDISIMIGWSAHTGTGSMSVGGLPFTSVSSAPNSVFSAYTDGMAFGAGRVLTPVLSSSQTAIALRTSDPAGGAGSLISMDTSVTILIMSGTYFV